MMRAFTISIACAAGLFAGSASASIITGYLQNWEGWQEAVGTYTTVDFIDIPPGTIVTDQYEDAGVVFVPITGIGAGWIGYSQTVFPRDGWGMESNALYLELTFTQPMHAIGMHGVYGIGINLFSGGEMIATQPFNASQSIPENFTGLVSEIAFDKVWISTSGWQSFIFVDNLYFSTVPAPSGLGLLFMAMAGGRRGRRR